ncbi:MAG: hypothetical protein C0510_08445 [Erythrobacter sp.]|nr:hypothetical protein [Erythrobacter sp.]
MFRAACCIAVAISLSGCQSFISALGFGPKDGPKRAEASEPIFGSQELERGRTALRAGYPANAIQQFRMAALDPDSAAEAYNGLGVAYARLGRADLAERYFKMALGMDGTNPRFAANLDRFYNSPLGNSSRALAMRAKEDEEAVARVADAAQQQGLLEAVPTPERQVERRGPVTLERPTVSVVRTSGREIQLASAVPARDSTRSATITVTPTGRTGTSLAMAEVREATHPVRVSVIRPNGEAANPATRQSYPIRIRLGPPKPAE